MDNSALSSLAGIHATIISIIGAALLTYFVYAYPMISNYKESLNELRHQVSHIMDSYSHYLAPLGSLDLYAPNGILNRPQISLVLWHATAGIPETQNQNETTNGLPPGPSPPSSEEIETTANDFLNLLSAFSCNYPYSERVSRDENGKMTRFGGLGIKRDYDEAWEEDLRDWNTRLEVTWRTRNKEIMQLLSRFTELKNKKDLEKFEQDRLTREERYRSSLHEHGLNLSEDEIEQRISYFKSQDEAHGLVFQPTDYTRFGTEFFSRISMISGILASISEKREKLTFYSDKFKIKNVLIQASLLIIFVLFFGIIIPLFICGYYTPPHAKSLGIFLVLTFVPYLFYIFYFLSKILSLNMP